MLPRKGSNSWLFKVFPNINLKPYPMTMLLKLRQIQGRCIKPRNGGIILKAKFVLGSHR